jgi:hypothetical protein
MNFSKALQKCPTVSKTKCAPAKTAAALNLHYDCVYLFSKEGRA